MNANTTPQLRLMPPALIRARRGAFYIPNNWLHRNIGPFPWDAAPEQNGKPGHLRHVRITKSAALALLRARALELRTEAHGNDLILREKTKGRAPVPPAKTRHPRPPNRYTTFASH